MEEKGKVKYKNAEAGHNTEHWTSEKRVVIRWRPDKNMHKDDRGPSQM